MTISLRSSLTVWFVGLATLVSLAGSLALYFVARSTLIRGVDAQLMAQAHGVASLCEYEDGAVHLEGYYEIDGHLPLLEGDHGFEVRLEPGGDVQVRSGRLLPPPVPGHRCGGLDQGDLRVMAIAVDFPARGSAAGADPEPESPGFTVLVRAAASLGPVEQELARIRWSAVLGAGGFLVISSAFALFLSQRLTGPLSRLGAAAIRLRDGHEVSLPRSGNGDEIDRLAVLLDQAFAAVRSSAAQQKRFVADASHELRNPVAIVASIAEIGLRRERTTAEYRDLLAEIESVSRRMTETLSSLLLMARLDEKGRVSGPKIDLAEVANEVVAQIETTPTVELELVPSFVAGDRVLLSILCRNLVENAARHARSRLKVHVGSDGDLVLIRIADDGPGVPQSERERIFDRFFRGESATGAGSGLGLALVRSIAQAHGGNCQLEASGVGLTVSVALPSWAP